jgi:hypothetical protein
MNHKLNHDHYTITESLLPQSVGNYNRKGHIWRARKTGIICIIFLSAAGNSYCWYDRRMLDERDWHVIFVVRWIKNYGGCAGWNVNYSQTWIIYRVIIMNCSEFITPPQRFWFNNNYRFSGCTFAKIGRLLEMSTDIYTLYTVVTLNI